MLKILKIDQLISKTNVRNEKDDSIQELADSILANGLLQPLTVRELSNGKYEILAGHRRYEALKIIHEDFVECNIVDNVIDSKDVYRVMLAENIQRKNMSAFEYVECFNMLIEKHGITKKQLAKFLNKSYTFVEDQYQAVRILNAQYGGNIPEEAKQKSAATIRSYNGLHRKKEPIKKLEGEGFSVKVKKHTYFLTITDYEFEKIFNNFLKTYGATETEVNEDAGKN